MMMITIFDTLTTTQGVVKAMSWDDVCLMLQNVPAYKSKAAQPLLKLGVFGGGSRGAGHSLVSISGVELDYDAGDVTATSAANSLRRAGIECVVCSTYTATLANPKWRVFAPTSRELSAGLRVYLARALDSVLGGIVARESFTQKQTFFVGRNPESTYIYYRVRGGCVDVVLKAAANAAYLADKRARTEREQVAVASAYRAESVRNHKVGGRLTDGQLSPIDEFNAAHDVRSILTAHGYRAKDGRYIAPSSASGMAGVVVLAGDDGRERVYSHHTTDALADGMAHDAFDLFRLLAHGGDEWAAIQAAAKLLPSHAGVNIHVHNRNVYRRAQKNAKAQAAINNLVGVMS